MGVAELGLDATTHMAYNELNKWPDAGLQIVGGAKYLVVGV